MARSRGRRVHVLTRWGRWGRAGWVDGTAEVALRNEGIDPTKIKDALFMFNPQTKAYEPFGPEQHQHLVAGKARL